MAGRSAGHLDGVFERKMVMPLRSLKGGARLLRKAEKTPRSASWFSMARVLVALSGCLLLGCGGKDQPVRVNGTVTLDGKPVDGAGVTFYPAKEGGRQASGITGSDGTFQLTTFKPNDGALAGEYKVTVQYSDPLSETDVPKVEQGKSMKDVWEAAMKAQKSKSKKPPKWVIPTKYSDPNKTELKQKVPTDGSVTLSLQSK
jgi:hypothetical protein